MTVRWLDWLRAPKRPDAVEAELFDEAFQRKLEYLAVASRRLFAGRLRAERRTRISGSGIEFADHRAYTPGDDLRDPGRNRIEPLPVHPRSP